MLVLHGSILTVTERPPREGYAEPLRTVAVFDGEESIELLCDPDAFAKLRGLSRFEDVTLILGRSTVNLWRLGGKGQAYRLRVVGVSDVPKR